MTHVCINRPGEINPCLAEFIFKAQKQNFILVLDHMCKQLEYFTMDNMDPFIIKPNTMVAEGLMVQVLT